MNYKEYYKSPLGMIEIVGEGRKIIAVDFVKKTEKNTGANVPIVKKCIKQLDEYFTGKRKKFLLKLKFNSTNFQKKVWQELLKIPFGETVSYKNIAEKIKNPKAMRAVGGAINKNKIAIIIPCHRVIGSDRKLVGYAGGLWRKKWLLEHEKIL